jgi:hypothetical protein
MGRGVIVSFPLLGRQNKKNGGIMKKLLMTISILLLSLSSALYDVPTSKEIEDNLFTSKELYSPSKLMEGNAKYKTNLAISTKYNNNKAAEVELQLIEKRLISDLKKEGNEFTDPQNVKCLTHFQQFDFHSSL